MKVHVREGAPLSISEVDALVRSAVFAGNLSRAIEAEVVLLNLQTGSTAVLAPSPPPPGLPSAEVYCANRQSCDPLLVQGYAPVADFGGASRFEGWSGVHISDEPALSASWSLVPDNYVEVAQNDCLAAGDCLLTQRVSANGMLSLSRELTAGEYAVAWGSTAAGSCRLTVNGSDLLEATVVAQGEPLAISHVTIAAAGRTAFASRGGACILGYILRLGDPLPSLPPLPPSMPAIPETKCRPPP